MMNVDTGKERLDLKRLWYQFVHKIWIVIAAAIAGAIIGVMAYIIYSHLAGPNQMFEIRNDYYITFNSKEYPNGVDYYNAYTWDSILRDDPIVNYALEINPELEKADILEAVSGEMLGDYRILTVSCKGTDSDKVQMISDAYKEALPHFASEIDMLSKVEVWTDAAMSEYDPYTREWNAGFLGGLIGLLASLFALLIACVLDDGIYTEQDWNRRYPDIPYLGYENTKEYIANRNYIIGEEDLEQVKVTDFDFDESNFERLRKGNGVVISVVRGMDKADAIDKAVSTLKKQNIAVKAMVICTERRE